MTFTTRYSHEAEKTLARLDRPTQKRVNERLQELERDPFDSRVSKPLRGDLKGLRSSRLGPWRIIYTLDEIREVLYVVSIGPRGGVYRDL